MTIDFALLEDEVVAQTTNFISMLIQGGYIKEEVAEVVESYESKEHPGYIVLVFTDGQMFAYEFEFPTLN